MAILVIFKGGFHKNEVVVAKSLLPDCSTRIGCQMPQVGFGIAQVVKKKSRSPHGPLLKLH